MTLVFDEPEFDPEYELDPVGESFEDDVVAAEKSLGIYRRDEKASGDGIYR